MGFVLRLRHKTQSLVYVSLKLSTPKAGVTELFYQVNEYSSGLIHQNTVYTRRIEV
jgi:hypothetical protein